MRVLMTGLLVVLFSSAVWAHGDDMSAPKAPPAQLPWGMAGDAKAVTRTIEIAMGDDMRFSPDKLEIKRGETVRFVIRNRGKQLHEMVIGSPEALAAHAEMMRKMPDMHHSEAWMAHVKGGSRGEMIWTFNRAGQFAFACLVAGHYEAGMRGAIVVK